MKKPNYWFRISNRLKYVAWQILKFVMLFFIIILISYLLVYLKKQPVNSQSRETKQVGILHEIPDNMPPIPKHGVPVSNPLFYKMFKTSSAK